MDSQDERDLLEALHDVLWAEFKNDLQRSLELVTYSNIDYELLWTIYPPGCVVICGQGADLQVGLLTECDYASSMGSNYFHVKYTYLDFVGKQYGWAQESIGIQEFLDVKCILELAIIPIQYLALPDHVQTILEAESRGKKAVALQFDRYQAYKGFIEFQTHRQESAFVDSRIILDAYGFSKHVSSRTAITSYPNSLRSLVPPESTCLKSTSSQTLSARDNDEDKDLLLEHRWTADVLNVAPEVFCSPDLRGYCFTSKKWATFNVDSISPIVWSDKAFDQLVISPPRKRLSNALVKQHKQHKRNLDDWIKGKGQGLVLLLNGPPGTGKTLTAESIADRFHLPLYALNASQLNAQTSRYDEDDDIEDKLTAVFDLAATWDAVVLMDEADAFLERRDSGDVNSKKNQRVAVFLRVLEYFRGVLILTSNRAIEFDEAFLSRIHLTLQYPALDPGAREAVWRNMLGMGFHGVRELEVEQLAQYDLNGRQIKNIIKMARLLAKEEEAVLSIEHLTTVLGIMQDSLDLHGSTQHLV